MKKERLIIGLVLVLAGFAALWFTRPSVPPVVEVKASPPPLVEPATPVTVTSAPPAAENPAATAVIANPLIGKPTPRPATPAPAGSPSNPAGAMAVAPPAPALASALDPRSEMDEVQIALRDYRTALGGNPVGTNAEITKALLGDNLKQIKIPLPRGTQLNGTGELCDHWGTPYFFHQLSASRMELRSAGPDRTMWTADDLQK